MPKGDDEETPLCACGMPLGGGQINGKPVCDQCYRSSQASEWARIRDQRHTSQVFGLTIVYPAIDRA